MPEPVLSPEAVVRSLCEAASTRDSARLRAFLTDDVVYHNIPMDPAVGLEAAMAVIDMFLAVCEELEFQVHHLAVDGETVLTERTDVFTVSIAPVESVKLSRCAVDLLGELQITVSPTI